MGSGEAKAKAKQSCQTEEFRQACSARELNKPIKERQKLAKLGATSIYGKMWWRGGI